jgi:hypothetical protein
MNWLLRLFSCSHPARHLSWVFTLKGRTYRVCLECGAELAYDLSAMKLTGELSTIHQPLSTAPERSTD